MAKPITNSVPLGTPAPPEILQEVATCAAPGCTNGAIWFHKGPWGPNFCEDDRDRIPNAVAYLYRNVRTGELLS